MDNAERIRQLERDLDAARALAARYAGIAAGLQAGALPSAAEDFGNRGIATLSVREGAIVVIDPGDGGTRYGLTGQAALDRWTAEIRRASPHLWPDRNGRSGTPGAAPGALPTGRNPWAKDTWNLTEQGRIARDNPTLARQMAAQAGVKLNI